MSASPGDRDWLVWAGLFGVGLAWEFRELREGPRGWTLSRVLRLVFVTRHPVGRTVFAGVVVLGGGWLVRHITGYAESVRNDVPRLGTP